MKTQDEPHSVSMGRPCLFRTSLDGFISCLFFRCVVVYGVILRLSLSSRASLLASCNLGTSQRVGRRPDDLSPPPPRTRTVTLQSSSSLLFPLYFSPPLFAVFRRGPQVDGQAQPTRGTPVHVASSDGCKQHLGHLHIDGHRYFVHVFF